MVIFAANQGRHVFVILVTLQAPSKGTITDTRTILGLKLVTEK